MRDKAPPLYEDIYARALAGTGGRSNAIKANCLQCCGWIRADVADCRITNCPLWHFRPYRTPKNRGVIETDGESGVTVSTEAQPPAEMGGL